MKRDMTGTKREATNCPIFLLQSCTVQVTVDYDDSRYEHDHDGEVFKDIETGKVMSYREFDDHVIETGEGRRTWTCSDGGVYWTRQDAEEAAENRSYYWGRKGKDWRVYCVSARGQLAKILDEHSEYESPETTGSTDSDN